MKQVLVSGMFRSGTTLLSRMLGGSGRALVVADPCIYVLKAWRRRLALDLGLTDFDPSGPTSDQFDPEYPQLEAAIQAGDLSEAVQADDLDWLRAQIEAWKHEQHPELCARLERVQGPTFADAWRSLIALAAELYGGPELECMGTKISWCEEFLPALMRALPELRVVLLVRDVRGVVASQNSKRGPGAGKRPLLFYARHWRKSVEFTERLSAPGAALRGRVLRMQYEDLVRAPEHELRRACGHLELPLDPGMLDPAGFRDESERPGWRGNSSFEAPARAIHAESVERWRRVLAPDEVRALESLCGPELERCGYPRSSAPLDPLDCLELDCEPAPEELSPWLVGDPTAAYLTDPERRRREYAAEAARQASGVRAGSHP